jgi:hypothetical protein
MKRAIAAKHATATKTLICPQIIPQLSAASSQWQCPIGRGTSAPYAGQTKKFCTGKSAEKIVCGGSGRRAKLNFSRRLSPNRSRGGSRLAGRARGRRPGGAELERGDRWCSPSVCSRMPCRRGCAALECPWNSGHRKFAPSCPLLALSGHPTVTRRCPLLGVKRTSRPPQRMSAFDPKRTFGRQAFYTAMGHFREAGLTRYDALSWGETRE